MRIMYMGQKHPGHTDDVKMDKSLKIVMMNPVKTRAVEAEVDCGS